MIATVSSCGINRRSLVIKRAYRKAGRIPVSIVLRRPVVLGYVEPSLTLTRGRSTVTLNAPVSIYENFRPSLIDRQLGSAGGGDLARFLLFAGYQVRF